MKNLTFLGEIFQTQTQTIDGWPNPSHKKLTNAIGIANVLKYFLELYKDYIIKH